MLPPSSQTIIHEDLNTCYVLGVCWDAQVMQTRSLSSEGSQCPSNEQQPTGMRGAGGHGDGEEPPAPS